MASLILPLMSTPLVGAVSTKRPIVHGALKAMAGSAAIVGRVTLAAHGSMQGLKGAAAVVGQIDSHVQGRLPAMLDTAPANGITIGGTPVTIGGSSVEIGG
jgi:hypothetical protein